jgi:hypothetical protein
VLTDPVTGVVASVEADMRLDSSTAPCSIVLQVLARGPIGKYAFSLEAASVTGGAGFVHPCLFVCAHCACCSAAQQAV